jgi:hypothetical protein
MLFLQSCQGPHAPRHQPFPRLGRVFPEPVRSTAQTEGVTPGVHIRAHALRTAAWHRGREQYLQVKHRIFFGEIAASVGI